MKNKLLFLFVTLIMVVQSFSNVQAVFNYKQFYSPSNGIYIENYLSFIASSLKYKKNENDIFQAHILVTQVLKKDNKIIDYKKYEILGPELIDSVALDFTDQQRFMLKEGEYVLEIEMLDLNREDSLSIISTQDVNIVFNSSATNLSGIELVDYFNKTEKKNKFSKSGYDVYPLVTNYLSSDINKLAYYVELYGGDRYGDNKDEKYLLKQYVEDFDKKKILAKYIKRSKIKLTKVKPIINAFEIVDLPTGNYNLVVELRNSKNELITIKKVFFQSLNSFLVKDTISENPGIFNEFLIGDIIDSYIETLEPIASDLELKFIGQKMNNFSGKQKVNFFYNFWSVRNVNNPKVEWELYKAKIDWIELEYATKLMKGYKTDRGRAYVKYGKPNTITDRMADGSSYPYQIWHYYNVGKINNVKFVFYQPNLITKDYELIHSDMPGEIQNRNWQSVLNKRTGAVNSNNQRNFDLPR